MGKLNVEKNAGGIEGLYVITPQVHEDNRGYFMETYNDRDYAECGITTRFVQDNQSMSRRGVLRGMHLQKHFPQAKLVRVLSGEVFDVAIDFRKGSPTFGKWFGVRLSAENKKQFFIPAGFAHGFFVLSETVEFAYKVDDYYHPGDEIGLMWNDETIGIKWPLAGVTPVLSQKDVNNFSYTDFLKQL